MTTIKQTELLIREEPNVRTARHWIGGEWLDSSEHRESINPAIGEIIGRYAMGGRKEAQRLQTGNVEGVLSCCSKHFAGQNKRLRCDFFGSLRERLLQIDCDRRAFY